MPKRRKYKGELSDQEKAESILPKVPQPQSMSLPLIGLHKLEKETTEKFEALKKSDADPKEILVKMQELLVETTVAIFELQKTKTLFPTTGKSVTILKAAIDSSMEIVSIMMYYHGNLLFLNGLATKIQKFKKEKRL